MAKKIKKNRETFIELVLSAYKLGWDECYYGDDSNKRLFKKDSVLRRAYKIGWLDYIAGDDVTSIDSQTDAQILENIFKK